MEARRQPHREVAPGSEHVVRVEARHLEPLRVDEAEERARERDETAAAIRQVVDEHENLVGQAEEIISGTAAAAIASEGGEEAERQQLENQQQQAEDQALLQAYEDEAASVPVSRAATIAAAARYHSSGAREQSLSEEHILSLDSEDDMLAAMQSLLED